MLKLHLCFRKHKINKNKFKVQVEQVYIQQEFYDEKGAKFIKNLTFLVWSGMTLGMYLSPSELIYLQKQATEVKI